MPKIHSKLSFTVISLETNVIDNSQKFIEEGVEVHILNICFLKLCAIIFLVRVSGKFVSDKVCVHLTEMCTKALCISFLRYFHRDCDD